MQIMNKDASPVQVSSRTMTLEAMQQDFDFEMAERFTRMLYENGLITTDEMNRISALNQKKFYPFYGDIMD